MNQVVEIASKSLKENQNVLELGCGNGDLINEVVLNNKGLDRVVAVDYFNKPEDLNEKVEFIKQNIEDLNINGEFDIVIMHHVFEHVKNPLGLIEKIKKMLRKNGRILIVVPNRYGFGNEAKIYLPEHGKHYFLWDKESLQYSLERLGFICRFHNQYVAGSHNPILKYLPALLRIQNPNLFCMAMLDVEE